MRRPSKSNFVKFTPFRYDWTSIKQAFSNLTMIGQLKSVLLIGPSKKIDFDWSISQQKNWYDSQSLVLIRIYLSDGRIGDDHKVFLLVKWWFHHDEQIIAYQIIYRIVYKNVDQISFLSSKFFLGHFCSWISRWLSTDITREIAVRSLIGELETYSVWAPWRHLVSIIAKHNISYYPWAYCCS